MQLSSTTKWLSLFFILAIVFANLNSTPSFFFGMSTPKAPPEAVSKLVGGISSFSADFFLKLYETRKNENIFFSAFSLSSALAMTAAGARGNTLKEMLETLKLSSLPPDELHSAFGTLLFHSHLFNNPSGPVQLDNANRLWIENTFPIHQQYQQVTKTFYHAGAEPTNFKGATEQERLRINQWIEEQTRQKIKDLIPAGGINAGTPLVLTNAIYFKANWVHKFDKAKTTTGDFTLLDGSKTPVSYMHYKEKLNYTHQGDYKAIEKPYTSPEGQQLSMVFVLPEDHGVEGLEKTLKALKPGKISQPPHFLTQMFTTGDVTISIPKFKLEFEVEASDILKKLGMHDAFASPDFSGISSHPLAIDRVFHKAFVEVNEEGTEAAAATAVVMLRMAARDPLTFHADRPFIFLIWDRTSQLILFSGLVNKPNPPQ